MVERFRKAPRREQRTAQTPAAVATTAEKTIVLLRQTSLMLDDMLLVSKYTVGRPFSRDIL